MCSHCLGYLFILFFHKTSDFGCTIDPVIVQGIGLVCLLRCYWYILVSVNVCIIVILVSPLFIDLLATYLCCPLFPLSIPLLRSIHFHKLLLVTGRYTRKCGVRWLLPIAGRPRSKLVWR
jgi:hypothetical protein